MESSPPKKSINMLSPWELPFRIGIPDVCVQWPKHGRQLHMGEARDGLGRSPLIPVGPSGNMMVAKVNGQTSPDWSGCLHSCYPAPPPFSQEQQLALGTSGPDSPTLVWVELIPPQLQG